VISTSFFDRLGVGSTLPLLFGLSCRPSHLLPSRSPPEIVVRFSFSTAGKTGCEDAFVLGECEIFVQHVVSALGAGRSARFRPCQRVEWAACNRCNPAQAYHLNPEQQMVEAS